MRKKIASVSLYEGYFVKIYTLKKLPLVLIRRVPECVC